MPCSYEHGWQPPPCAGSGLKCIWRAALRFSPSLKVWPVNSSMACLPFCGAYVVLHGLTLASLVHRLHRHMTAWLLLMSLSRRACTASYSTPSTRRTCCCSAASASACTAPPLRCWCSWFAARTTGVGHVTCHMLGRGGHGMGRGVDVEAGEAVLDLHMCMACWLLFLHPNSSCCAHLLTAALPASCAVNAAGWRQRCCCASLGCNTSATQRAQNCSCLSWCKRASHDRPALCKGCPDETHASMMVAYVDGKCGSGDLWHAWRARGRACR